MQGQRLGRTFAGRITGLDLARGLTGAEVRTIREAWLELGVAVFPEQRLGDDELVAFTAALGPLFVHVRSQFHSRERPEVLMIANVDEPGRDYRRLGEGPLGWHTDQAYTRQPAFGTVLYALEVPAAGGETEFADLAAAYAEMPGDLRRRVEGKRIVYSIEATARTQGIAATAAQRARTPDVAHPIVRRHPYRDLSALYVSPDHAVRVEGMAPVESRRLLGDLIDWVTRPAFRYVHGWAPGDVVLWDNTRTIHRRVAFPPEQRRVLKRTGFMLPESLGTPSSPSIPR